MRPIHEVSPQVENVERPEETVSAQGPLPDVSVCDISARPWARRTFLSAAAAMPLLSVSRAAFAERRQNGNNGSHDAAKSFSGLITRQKNPDNLEFPFSGLDSFLTPNEHFYVRNHFKEPELDADKWQLTVEGAVDRPLTLSYRELCELPSRTVTALLECSGNGRVFLKPPEVGIRWEQGAVSNAEWTGVSLSTVLDRAGVKDQAVEVILEGADQGEFRPPEPKSPGIIPFARSMPIKETRRPEVILAYRMNGQELPKTHGRPVRMIVPGWYGMASVKWLKRIIVADRPFQGFFQTFMYTTWQRQNGLPTLTPVQEIQVKSQIARPALHEIVPANAEYLMHGAAWTGNAEIAKVEVSTDGGKTWADAELDQKSVRFSWRFWSYAWKTPARRGRYTLMVKATDDKGRVQPVDRDNDRRDAVITHVQSTDVYVR